MKKILNIYWLFLLLLSACVDDKEYINLTDDVPPSPVTNVRVENLNGAAKIFYNIPADQSLRYVRAEYKIRDGEYKEAKSSLYTNFVLVDGFPTTSTYEVKLFAVSNGEKSSEPTIVKVNPLTSPLEMAYNSLSFSATFGGISITAENESEASIAISLLTPNNEGFMTEVETFYTKSKNPKFYSRGFESELRKFGIIVRDRWGNVSDTAFVELVPIFEEQVPKPYQTYNLPGDTYEAHLAGQTVDRLWDDQIATGSVGLHTKPGTGMPQHFTFDLRHKVKLSRYKFYQRGAGNSYAYRLGSPKKWEIWGSNNPDPQGSWAGWEKLMDCESYKPSGSPVGINTDEDNYYALYNGEEFTFPEEAPPSRYIRFRTLETWDYLDYIYIAELTFWGIRVQ